MAVKDVVHNQPPLDEKILTGLSRIGQAMRANAQKLSMNEQLSPTQAKALVEIARGTSVASVLAERLNISRASLSDSIASLIEKGLVRRNQSTEDSRVFFLELTAKGRKRSDLMSKWPDELLAALHDLSPDDKSALMKAMSKIIVGLQEQNQVSTQRMCATCRFFRPNQHPGSRKVHHCAYVDAAFSDSELRLDCPEQETAEKKMRF